jgi:hypothetical protein
MNLILYAADDAYGRKILWKVGAVRCKCLLMNDNPSRLRVRFYDGEDLLMFAMSDRLEPRVGKGVCTHLSAIPPGCFSHASPTRISMEGTD